MKVQNWPIEAVKPYPNNPRRNGAAVNAVAESIKDFGFQQPIVVDEKGVIIVGHTRLQAAKKLKMSMVPVTVAHLTEEEAKAYRLADNKTSELAEWDESLLQKELDEIFDFDMGDFGFEFYDPDVEHEKQKIIAQKRVENIQNLGRGQFKGCGEFDIPEIKPVYELPKIERWIGFNYMLTDPEPEKHAVHFFVDDYQFERLWTEPDKYIDKLRKYVCVASPDFSPYGDMPQALQIYNHYRKHWLGAYMQAKGITVIPTIRASSDIRCKSWFLDGEPKGGIIIVSNMWASESNDEGATEIDVEIEERLQPKKIFVYGKKTGTDMDTGAEVEYISMFTDKFRGEK